MVLFFYLQANSNFTTTFCIVIFYSLLPAFVLFTALPIGTSSVFPTLSPPIMVLMLFTSVAYATCAYFLPYCFGSLPYVLPPVLHYLPFSTYLIIPVLFILYKFFSSLDMTFFLLGCPDKHYSVLLYWKKYALLFLLEKEKVGLVGVRARLRTFKHFAHAPTKERKRTPAPVLDYCYTTTRILVPCCVGSVAAFSYLPSLPTIAGLLVLHSSSRTVLPYTFVLPFMRFSAPLAYLFSTTGSPFWFPTYSILPSAFNICFRLQRCVAFTVTT